MLGGSSYVAVSAATTKARSGEEHLARGRVIGYAREKSFGFPLSCTCSSSPTVGFQRGHRGSGRYGEQVEFERTCARVLGAERCCPAYGLDHTPSPILARNRVIYTAVTRSTRSTFSETDSRFELPSLDPLAL